MDWLPIEAPPAEPRGVLLWTPEARHVSVLAGHDFSIEVGFWNGQEFCEQGTGHCISERIDWGKPMPTLYTLIDPPAEPADDPARSAASSGSPDAQPSASADDAGMRKGEG